MRKLLPYVLTVAMAFATATVFAKSINLYLEPKTDSKVTGTVDPEAGVTVIYTPKSGDWVKVANPLNGDVGWIKSNDLGGNPYNIHIITSSNGVHNESVYEFNTGSSSSIKYDQAELQKQMKRFEEQERMMQLQMTDVFNHLFYFPQPLFVPVLIVPEQSKVEKKSSTTDQTNQSSQGKLNKH